MRLRNIGLVTWFATLLILILVLLLIYLNVSTGVVVSAIITIILGFIPTGAATRKIRFVEAPQPENVA
jgi:hypothetical protein